MLSDTLKAIQEAESAAGEALAAAQAEAKAKIGKAQEQSRAALAEAERRTRREYESARQKAQKEAERTVLDAKGLAKSAAQSTEEFLKTKIAAAADEVLGGIRLKWQ